MDMNDARERLLKHYEEIEALLCRARADVDAACVSVMDSAECALRDACMETLGNLEKHFLDLKDKIPEGEAWDTCNVVFLGETNSGKSTLIETLLALSTDSKYMVRWREESMLLKNLRRWWLKVRWFLGGGWGGAIGDGSPDFTKQVVRHEVCFSEHKMMLADLPGIEGKEAELIDEIEHGLGKANVVLYLVGNSKKPERGTIEKLKRYLSQDALVYAICNIHCPAKANRVPMDGSYAENLQEKYEDAEREAARQIHESLKSAFGETFRKVDCVNVHLAFCSVAYDRAAKVTRIVRKRKGLLKAQVKYAKEFQNDYDAMQEASRIERVKDLLKSCAENFPKERVEQCKRNLWSWFCRLNLEEFCKDVLAEKRRGAAILERLDQAHRNFDRLIDEIPMHVTAKFRERYREMLYGKIEDWEEFDKEKAEWFIGTYERDMQEYLEIKVKERVQHAAKILEEDYRQAGRDAGMTLWRNFEAVIQTSAASKGILSVAVDDEEALFSTIVESVFSVFGAVAIRGVLAAVFGFSGPGGWVLGFVFCVGQKFLRYLMGREERIAKAKNKANRFVEDLTKQMEKSLRDACSQIGLGERVRQESYEVIRKIVRERGARLEWMNQAIVRLQEGLEHKKEEIGGYSYGEA